MKTCRQCQRNLPLSDYHRDGKRHGRRAVCKTCINYRQRNNLVVMAAGKMCGGCGEVRTEYHFSPHTADHATIRCADCCFSFDQGRRITHQRITANRLQRKVNARSAGVSGEVHQMLTAWAMRHGYTFDELVAGGRRKPLPELRGAAARVLWHDYQMPVKQIALTLGYSNHTSILYWLNAA